MIIALQQNQQLLEKYGTTGPRYTSYPTVKQFHSSFSEEHFRTIAKQSNEDLIPKPLSLYIHIPFCEKVCFYCACNKIITANREHAKKYLQYLKKEINMHAEFFDKDRIVDQLHFGGGTPTYIDSDQLESLILCLRQHFNIKDDDSGDYSIEIDPRQIGKHSMEKLRLLGFNRISIGVQDVDALVQKAVNRIQSIEETSQIVTDARNNNFKSINLDLIYGLPHQTLESFSKTLDSVINMSPDRIAIYNYAHMPKLFKMQNQIDEKDLPAPSIKISILNSAIKKLQLAGYDYIGMDHFAKHTDSLCIAQNQGTLQRNFQGYTTNNDCDQLGLGVSSISKVSDSYSQNHSNLSEYYSCIDNNKLPVKHGYKLDIDDLLRREIIMNLICNLRLQTEDIENKFDINFEEYFYNELLLLNEMQDDGLISYDTNTISVSPSGRFMIRNICSVFDKYNQHRGENQESFSKQI